MTDNLLVNNEDEIVVDPNKNYLEELVGDGKKFKSPEDLAKGKFYADQTIELMKKRQDEMRADYLKLREENVTKARLEEIIDQLANKQLASSANTTAKEDKPAIDKTELESLVSSKIQEYEATKKATSNFDSVKIKLKEQFGDNYPNVLKQMSSELGLSDEYINDLARKSPTAFYRTFGLDQPQERDGFNSPPRSQQRRDSFAPTSKQKRTWSYYQELKKKDPALYYNPKIGVQMAQDATELGTEFQDGDYFVRGLHENN